jgi:hypothetical protein
MEKERPEVLRRCFEKLIEAKKKTVSDILEALPFPVADLEELADLELGTLTGAPPDRGDLPFKDEVETTGGNVVRMFPGRNHVCFKAKLYHYRRLTVFRRPQ